MALLQNVIQRGTLSARPAAGSAGILYFASDQGQLYRDSGSAWQLVDATSLYSAKGQLLAASASGAVAALAAGTDTYVLTADATQTLGVKWAAAGAAAGLVQIATTTLSGAQATISFSSIAGTYSSLELVVMGRGDAAATSENLLLQLNGDTGNNYDWQINSAVNASTSNAASIATSSLFVGSLAAANAPSGTASSARITLPAYAGTTFHKTALSLSSLKQANAAGNVYANVNSGWWRSTAAITSITLSLASGNFAAGSSAQLYGLV